MQEATDDPNEELIAEIIECDSCEAKYTILLSEDYLQEEARFCPFCSEYVMRD